MQNFPWISNLSQASWDGRHVYHLVQVCGISLPDTLRDELIKQNMLLGFVVVNVCLFVFSEQGSIVFVLHDSDQVSLLVLIGAQECPDDCWSAAERTNSETHIAELLIALFVGLVCESCSTFG